MTVDKMQHELNELQPILAAKTVDTEALLVQVRGGQDAWSLCPGLDLLYPPPFKLWLRALLPPPPSG